MTPEEKHRYTEPLIHYSEDRAFTLPAKFPLDTEVKPLFEGNMVSQPIAVLKEGTYRKVVEMNGKMQLATFKYSKKDLEAMVANAERDVPLNYDHMRGGPNNVGWVRTKTGKFYVDKTEDGKFTLFAQVEARPEAIQAIEGGFYRDFSPEIRPYETRFVGLALTNYPVMQGLHQFSELENVDAELPSEDVDIFTEDVPMTDTERDALMTELRSQIAQEFSERVSGLEQALETEKTARQKAEREARMNQYTLEFSDKIRKLVGEKVPPAMRDALLNLYLFAAQHDADVVEFGEGDGAQTLSPVQLLDTVFDSLPKLGLFEQVITEGEAAEVDEEHADSSPDGFSVEEMKALRERVKEISFEETK